MLLENIVIEVAVIQAGATVLFVVYRKADLLLLWSYNKFAMRSCIRNNRSIELFDW